MMRVMHRCDGDNERGESKLEDDGDDGDGLKPDADAASCAIMCSKSTNGKNPVPPAMHTKCPDGS